jgi:hypothetical protein
MCCIIFILFSSKRRLFHNSTSFDSCIIHILNTECAKIKKKAPAPKGNSRVLYDRENRPTQHSVAGVDDGNAVHLCEVQTKLLFLIVIK